MLRLAFGFCCIFQVREACSLSVFLFAPWILSWQGWLLKYLIHPATMLKALGFSCNYELNQIFPCRRFRRCRSRFRVELKARTCIACLNRHLKRRKKKSGRQKAPGRKIFWRVYVSYKKYTIDFCFGKK